MIAPERVLAALAGDEYAQLNLNRDAYQDLAVLTVSEDKTAVEFYLSISDPDTGELQVASFNPTFLPYHPDRVTDVYYQMFFEMEWWFGVSVTSVETGVTLHISFINPEDGPISIAQTSTFRASVETSASVEICRIVYDVFEGQLDGGKAFIHLPDGEAIEYDSGSPPAMTDWRYTDLPAVCIP